MTILQRWVAFAVAVALVAVASLGFLLGTTSPAAAHTQGDITFAYDESPDLPSTRPLAPTVADWTQEGRVERSFRGGGTSTGGIASAETTLRSEAHPYGQPADLVAPGSLRTVGSGFSASEQRVAQLLADGGDTVVLREATGVGRTSDLLVNGVPYDVYTPTTGNIDRIVSAVSSKGSQVQGGGVIIDLTDSPLTPAQLGDILPRVQGVTSQISDIRVVGG